jgi:thiol-disulfide isomerase/thioredoxin
MILRFIIAAALAACVFAQGPSAPQPSGRAKEAPKETQEEREDREIEAALAEAGSSPVEYARALERHLQKYPQTTKREELERVLAQAAVDARDNRRILLYGVPAIESGLRNPQALDFVTRALLDKDDKESLERALKFSGILQEMLGQGIARLNSPNEQIRGRGRRLDETERAMARAQAFQARALGKLGRTDEAVAAAAKAWNLAPSAETAAESARWLEAASRPREALDALAAAMALSTDPANAVARERDLDRMAKLAKTAAVPAGEALLAAYERTSSTLAARRARISALDPNAFATKPAEHVLTTLDGKPLPLQSLAGKVVVFDFWATWCGPCRAQHPLYEEVKARFKGNADVVFLAVSTDEDRSLVVPFLEKNKWSKDVWFEDGLADEFRINSIPTTIVLDRGGQIQSRMNGYIASRFVDMLTLRIREALGQR